MKTLRLLIIPAILVGVCLGGCNKDKNADLQPVEKPAELKPAQPTVEVAPVAKPAETKVTVRPITEYAKPQPITVKPSVATASTSSNIYVIQKGDTLWSIAKKNLGDGQRWKDIVSANPGLKPEAMSIGQKIVLPAK